MNSKGLITKNLTCKHCGKLFDADRSNRKYCTKQCYTASQQGKMAYPNVVGKRGTKPRTAHLNRRDKHGNVYDVEWRKKVFERDNYTCQYCGVKGKRIQAHHIKPYKAFPELRHDLKNGITLCMDCHKRTDSYGWANYWSNYKKIAEQRLKNLQQTLL